MFRFENMFGNKKAEEIKTDIVAEEKLADGEQIEPADLNSVAKQDLQDGEIIKPIDINTGEEVNDLEKAA